MGKTKKREFDPSNLPAVVYVKMKEDDNGDGYYLLAAKDLEDEENGTIIGTYTLDSIGTINVRRTLDID